MGGSLPSFHRGFNASHQQETRNTGRPRLDREAPDRAGAALQPSDSRVMLEGAERSQPIATVKTIDPSGDPQEQTK